MIQSTSPETPLDAHVRVLLIEDNPGDRRLIREMLHNTPGIGIELTFATTLQEGLEKIGADVFDAVLLDLSLPDSLGVETLTTVRSNAPHVAIVVLTGFDDQSVGMQSVQSGAQDFLVKGQTDSRLLSRTLLYAIERHRNEVSLRRSEEEYRSLINDVFDTSMVAVLILNNEFTVVWCNTAAEIYFGMNRTEMLGQDKRVLIDKKLRCTFADPDDYMTQLLDGYNAGTFTTRLECHVLPDTEASREERWLEYWSQSIRDGMYRGGRIEQYTDITNRKAYEIAEQEQREYAEALREVASLLTSTLDLQQVLERIVGTLHRVVPYTKANIMLLQNNRIRVINSDQSMPITLRDNETTILPASPLTRMLRTRQPVLLHPLSSRMAKSLGVDINIPGKEISYIGVPILLRTQISGFINVFIADGIEYTDKETERLLAFAQQAAIAIENARLYNESSELATIQERQRLARELHDSVSQTLFTATAMAESALRMRETAPERSFNLVEDVHRLNQTALAEMRVLLLELRPASLTNISLKQLLDQYLKPIQVRRELEITVDVPDTLHLPASVQISLYRIIQEAFNNIDKHAQATRVYATVIENDNGIELVIRDNGRGFESEDVKGTSLGLQIMRERAREVGATMEINSGVGQGTRISLFLPAKQYMENTDD